ncbi:DUF6452 family protein [Ichthyenterobacterium magnum]|uniref:Uncharacterized protein n=1 Tax=Ichthyenterobacterium magnum TaxID=1230530 RepID=A0A420DKM7_9FLAO|nr:DUF6452 family protein [Ichthyenterobacterium magnum]RKE94751.1 hypothetical protein BXY80_1763 [Ichthyenterobacterium magnum]
MKRISLILIFISTFALALISIGCERDDICAETTATTPHLIIRFYDNSNPDETKNVRRLSVRGINDDGTEREDIIFNTDSDSIVLPLRFQDEGVPVVSKFILEKDTDLRLDEDTSTNSNIDIIEITTTPKFEYVSRACGYKSIFESTSLISEVDTNNWISSITIINTTIENENEAHINIFH